MERTRFDMATESPWRIARHRFAHHRGAMQGLALLMAVVLGDALVPPLRGIVGDESVADALQAGHATLAFAVAAALGGVLLGGVWGWLAALFGGPIGRALMRAAAGLAALPLALLPVVAAGLGGGGPLPFDAAVLLALVPGAALATHGIAVEAGRHGFVAAAQAAGLGRYEVWRRHTLPNVLGPLLVALWPALPRAVLVLSLGAFLGVGGAGTWGAQIGAAKTLAALLPPALLLAATLAALHAIGHGIEAAFAVERP
ncbi:ABC transporter permease subunit [Azospirillum sp. TSO22-1]|uniref:ABC transporter permease subunit n=1 Tax=Azospirillum sp. TSO22-1 TaxID=716789 RepID=UPI000D64D232|nr:ABC transporter permease subunit [Azospirillum sp. TSO22-1]